MDLFIVVTLTIERRFQVRESEKTMKTKILFGGWMLSIFIIIILGTYIVKSEPKCDRKHLDEIDRSKELIPDEETALKIADAIISVDKDVEWDEDFTYEVSVSFDEETYEWLVMYAPTIPGKVVFDGGNYIWIRKDNGYVHKWYLK